MAKNKQEFRDNTVPVRFSDSELAMLDDMAAEAGKARSRLAHDLIVDVLKDDAAAHKGRKLAS